jgi:predicted nicotinamide N-methyase
MGKGFSGVGVRCSVAAVNGAAEGLAVPMALREDRLTVHGVELSLLRPPEVEALIDEERFFQDEFMPYWAELWPAGLRLADALPDVREQRVVELGCGLGVPSLVAAAHGADVTATDWAPEAIELLETNAARNGVEVKTEVRDWRKPWKERFDVALASDVLYERRNVKPLLARLAELAPVALIGLAGRPYESTFLHRLGAYEQHVAPNVVRLSAVAA